MILDPPQEPVVQETHEERHVYESWQEQSGEPAYYERHEEVRRGPDPPAHSDEFGDYDDEDRELNRVIMESLNKK